MVTDYKTTLIKLLIQISSIYFNRYLYRYTISTTNTDNTNILKGKVWYKFILIHTYKWGISG